MPGAAKTKPQNYRIISYRLFFALLTFGALITEVATLHERGRFAPANFFSFFTVEFNTFAVLILLVSSIRTQGRLIAMLRGASTLYMTTVGLVFALLLSNIKGAEFTAVPWDNIVLHYLMPIAVVLDWFIDLPKIRIAFKQALIWLSFPIAYVTYTLIRGHFVDWYPYPFLDPRKHGYINVAVTSLGIAGAIILLTWILTRFTRHETATKPSQKRIA